MHEINIGLFRKGRKRGHMSYMRMLIFRKVLLFIVGLLFIVAPAAVYAEQPSPPPIAPPLVREGDFAAKLALALGVAATEDEIEAESQLGALGIAPRNGWIADYPITPDIIGELQLTVSDAVTSGKLSMSSDEASKRLFDVTVELGLAVKPYAQTEISPAEQSGSDNYPSNTEINNYYYSSGPPVVTYYAPPQDYYYLYAWVPSPFWWFGFWFPGFYVLNDFHKVVVVNHRTVFVSNHFRDITHQRVYRIDPVHRYHGSTYSGIGVSHPKNFMSTGVPRSSRTIFNRPGYSPPEQTLPGGRIVRPPARSDRQVSSPSRGRGTIGAIPHGGEKVSPPAQGRPTAGPPSPGDRKSSPSTPRGKAAGTTSRENRSAGSSSPDDGRSHEGRSTDSSSRDEGRSPGRGQGR